MNDAFLNRRGPCLFAVFFASLLASSPAEIDFNAEVRPILSNRCFRCHGPDEAERKAGLRLDTAAGAVADLGGTQAVVPGDPEASELLRRISTHDLDDLMPPPEAGSRLTEKQVRILESWIREGAVYQGHWAYEKPVRPRVPTETRSVEPANPIDAFLAARLAAEGLDFSPEADRTALIRRVTLDLTGLPPSPAEVRAFVADTRPTAYERLVDRLLAGPAFGEHWARMWLDLARYADSAGYADDPPRTIWAFRDYVIRAFNANQPFDQFTIEQLAGDLLPDPTKAQRIATAFHRNTQTNNEGGTSDEEFRNVAVVDRVNTTMQVWMGTTFTCAQCHTHKYDPITQEEYFKVFAILNNTADADRTDESPTLPVFSDEQSRQRKAWENEIAALEASLTNLTPELEIALAAWEKGLRAEPVLWEPVRISQARSHSGAELTVLDDGSLLAEGPDADTEVYEIEIPAPSHAVTGVRLEALADDRLGQKGPGRNGNFVLSEIELSAGEQRKTQHGRFVRIELPGEGKLVHVAEVQVFVDGQNVALQGEARQSSTAFGGKPERAIDGNTNGDYNAASTTHTADGDRDPWWEVDLGAEKDLARIVVWNRTDNDLQSRLDGFRLLVLDAERRPVWQMAYAQAPQREVEAALDGRSGVAIGHASASHEQEGFEVMKAIDGDVSAKSGWAVAPRTGRSHEAVFELSEPLRTGVLSVTLHQLYPKHALGRFRLSVTAMSPPLRALPDAVSSILAVSPEERSIEQRNALLTYFTGIHPPTVAKRKRIEVLQKKLEQIEPITTVPVMKELAGEKRRQTFLQYRGSFLDTGPEVTPGVPEAFHELPEGVETDRMGLARWLVSDENPLTGRVVVNRFWEKLFGVGIVSTSEEFGSQGELPSHPELLDWLAVDFVESGWDMKRILAELVTSRAYRQSSRVTPELMERDPANRWLARGPRFRLTAEMVRDQALAVSGLLSRKMFGAPVKPPQPKLGVNAAFGGGIDWQTSEGEDRFRRGLYTTWRRSNPYPSMAAFDAPNREVCTVRRDRTNTPLQAFVTLNDPVYVEAAQALARRMSEAARPVEEAIEAGFRHCLGRDPDAEELGRLVRLYEEASADYENDPDKAEKMATLPLGPASSGADLPRLAALSVVANVLLNLDEMLMKR